MALPTPNPEFLSDIVTFETVLLGIAIPLSYSFVINFAEKVGSIKIYKIFFSKFITVFLSSFLFINILLSILLRLITSNDSNSNPSISVVFLEYLLFLSALLISYCFYKFINTVAEFTNIKKVGEITYSSIEDDLGISR
jgi:hypothetical protein